MNKKFTLYLLSVSLLTLSEGYALFGFGSKNKKDDPKAKIEKMVKEGFPSSMFGSCTKTAGGVKFDVAIQHYKDSQKDGTLLKAYDSAVNKKLEKLKECAKKKNPNFTKALAASCKTHKDIIPDEWTRSKALCKMVSGKQGDADLAAQVERMIKEGFPSAKLGSCTKTDAGVKFDVAISHYKGSQGNQKLLETYDSAVNQRLAKLKECAAKKNPNFTQVLAASCKTHKDIIPDEWTRSKALCKMVSGKQGAVEAKNAAINFMKEDYGSSKFACSKGYGKISWSGATEKFKMLSEDAEKAAIFDNYRKITDDHLTALTKCAVEKNKNFAAVLHESCTTDAPIKQWKSAVKLCKKAAKIMGDRSAAADAKAQAKIDDKLFPGMLAKIGCTKGVAAPFDPAGLADYMKRQGDIVGAKGGTTPQAKQQAMKNGRRVLAYVDRLGKCAVKEGDVNFNKILAEKFGEADKHCKLDSLKQYQGTKVGNLLKKFHVLCKVTKKTSAAIGKTQDVEAAFKTLKLPSKIMAPAAYHICNEVMTEMWQDEDGIQAIKTILVNEKALPKWQKHIAGIHGCISKNDKKTGVTKNPIMTSYIVSSAAELRKLGNEDLKTLVADAETIQERKEEYDNQELEVNVDEDDVANMDDVAEAPESYDGEDEAPVAGIPVDEDDDEDSGESGDDGSDDESIGPDEEDDDDSFAKQEKPGAVSKSDVEEDEAVPAEEEEDAVPENEEEAPVEDGDEAAPEDVGSDFDDTEDGEDPFAASANDAEDGEEDEEVEWLD